MATNNYPLPVFHFSVKWSDDDENISFSEVSGLNVETQVIEYRNGANQEYTTFKLLDKFASDDSSAEIKGI